MPERPRPTAIDYVVVALNPALVMILVGSLIYFLVEMFYQGQYPERLHFCLTMFVFAAVLIARISMDEGREHAAPFGIALGIMICLAMHQFVTYKGTNLEQVGWLINYGLIALAWWCADRLTWDCTLVDESQDASGEGLLQTVGLDAADEETAKPQKGAAKEEKKSRSTVSEPPTDSILPPEHDS